jgi:hypothetical protein
VASNQGSYIWR